MASTGPLNPMGALLSDYIAAGWGREDRQFAQRGLDVREDAYL